MAGNGVPQWIIAMAVGVKENTLKKKMYEDEPFYQLYQDAASRHKGELIQTASELAKKGDKTMLIFLLKTMCRMSEKHDADGDDAQAQAEAIRGTLDRMRGGTDE